MKKITFALPLLAVLGAAACSSSSSSTSAPLADGGTTTGLADGGSTTGDGGGTGRALAPLDWTFDGTPTTFQGVSFDAPKGWTPKTTADTEMSFTAPTTEGTVVLDVLAPRPTAGSGEAALRTQLWSLVTTAFTGHTLTDPSHNATPVEGLLRGTAAQGYTFVGYDLLVDGGSKSEIHAYLAAFGATAVPFVVLFDPSNARSTDAASVNEAQFFQTLGLAGFNQPVSLADSFTGDYTLPSTSVVESYTFPTPSTYIFTLETNFNGVKSSSQWTGDVATSGNVVSFYNTKGTSQTPPYAEYFRFYERSDTATAGGWDKFFCLFGADSAKTAGSEVCFKH